MSTRNVEIRHRCQSRGWLSCDRLRFKHINADKTGYYAVNASRPYYLIQDLKWQWNRLIARFCDDACPYLPRS